MMAVWWRYDGSSGEVLSRVCYDSPMEVLTIRLDIPHYWAASEHMRFHIQAFYLSHFRIFCKSQGSDFFTGWWLMNNDYASSPSSYNIVIQLIIMTTKQIQMKLEVTHWEKLTSLWLPDFPKWRTQFSYTNQLRKILKKYPHYLLLITCWILGPKAQLTTQRNQRELLVQPKPSLIPDFLR